MHEKNFAQTLREVPCSLPHPTVHGFDPQIWHQAWQAQNDGTPQDYHLYLLGAMLGQQSAWVQDGVQHLSSQLRRRSVDELIPHFSRRVNDVQRMAVDSWARALENVDIASSEGVRELRCFADSAGNLHAVQAPMEAVVDAIAQMLGLLRYKGGLGQLGGDEVEAIELEPALAHLMALAQHSLSIQRIWSSALWLRAVVAVDPVKGRYAVDESNSDLARRKVVDLSRRSAFLGRSLNNAKRRGEDVLPEDVFLPWVILESGRLRVTAIPASFLPEKKSRELLTARGEHSLLQDASLADFIEHVHPAVGLPIKQILVIWGELAVIAGQIHSLAHSVDTEADSAALSTILESRLVRSELIASINRCVVLPADKTAECLDFLCFKPAKGVTLWDKPLLATGNEIALLWWPLQGAHHARLLSAWAKTHRELPPEFDRKGDRNEKMMAEAMRDAIARSPYRDRVHFVGTGLHPRQKPDEEIDMLILVDDIAFVIEMASIPSPAEPYEFHETEIRLDRKAKQCRTQSDLLLKDLVQIQEWTKGAPAASMVTKVFGVVITNSYLRDGNYSDDICYCHWETLLNLISSGGMHFGVMRGQQELTLKAPISLETDSSVADALVTALKCSPKAEFYQSCLTQVDQRLQGFNAADYEGIYRAWTVDFPSADVLESRLRRLSFGPQLQEVDEPDFD